MTEPDPRKREMLAATRARRSQSALTENIGRSPRILSVAWGRMEVDGLGVGKDFMLYPGGGREWDCAVVWRRAFRVGL